MTDLDRRFDEAAGELHDHLQKATFGPASTIVRRHRRQRRTRGVAAAALVVVAGCLATFAATATRSADPVDPASPLDPFVRRMADSLLFPASGAGGGLDRVTFGPASGFGLIALVRSPTGALFEVGLAERGGAEWTPGLERRTIGGQEFTVELFEGQYVYTSIADCTYVSVSESSQSATGAWDDQASALLAALEVADTTATLSLPAGWTSTDVGRPGQLIQIGFHAPIDGTQRAASMMQLPNTSLAALLPLAGTPLEETTFDGRQAFTSNRSQQRTLVWQDGDNAVLVGSVDASLDDLRTLAHSLEHGHADRFVAYMWSNSTASEGTLPPDIAARTAGCEAPQLSVDAS